MSTAKRVKLAFALEPDEDGYPPYAVEHLWAEAVDKNRYKVDNIPFFVKGIAYGDIVTASPGDGGLEAEDLAETAGHSTIRVIVYDLDKVAELRTRLRRLGCGSELSDVEGLVAVDIPPAVSYASVVKFLEEGCMEEVWDYEESAIGHEI